MTCTCDGDDGSGVLEEITTQECTETPTCEVPAATECGIAPAYCACGCNPCQCETSRGTGACAFYNQAPSCQEDHTKLMINQSFVTAVTTAAAINMPVCNGTVSISLPGVLRLQPGGYLWNITYGYLRIVSFDPATSRTVVANDCQISNAAPGTPIPACTMFNVVDPPYTAEEDGCGGDGIFLTADFVAPVLHGSVTIQVTGTAGLTYNRDVQVGVGVYTLTAIVTPYSITIRNDGGLGIVPGTVIHALDALGNCITPITPYVIDACAEIPVINGALQVCYLGLPTTLDATALGQVPVVVDVADNLVEFQSLDVPAIECTVLTSCLNLVSGTDNYVAVVADSSIFYVGQLVVIKDPNIDTEFWLITGLPDGTHIHISAVDPNTYTGSIPDGREVCEAFCCDQLDYELNHFGDKICDQDWSNAFANDYDLSYEAPEGATIDPGDPDFTATTRTLEFTNDTCNQMIVMCHVEYLVQGTFNTSEMSWAKVALKPYIGHTTAAIPGPPVAPVPTIIKTLTDERAFGMGPGAACNAYNSNYFIQYHHTEIFTVPANTMLRIDAYQQFSYLDYEIGTDACCACAELGEPGTGTFTIVGSTVYMHAVGISIQEA